MLMNISWTSSVYYWCLAEFLRAMWCNCEGFVVLHLVHWLSTFNDHLYMFHTVAPSFGPPSLLAAGIDTVMADVGGAALWQWRWRTGEDKKMKGSDGRERSWRTREFILNTTFTLLINKFSFPYLFVNREGLLYKISLEAGAVNKNANNPFVEEQFQNRCNKLPHLTVFCRAFHEFDCCFKHICAN